MTKKKEQLVMSYLQFIDEDLADRDTAADADNEDKKRRIFNLKNLLLNDVAFAEEFIGQDGVPKLAEFVVRQEGNTLTYALAALKNLFTYVSALSVLSDDREQGISIMRHVYELLDHKDMITRPYHPNIYRNALEILIVLVNFVDDGAHLLHKTAKRVAKIRNAEVEELLSSSKEKQRLSGIDILRLKYRQQQQQQQSQVSVMDIFKDSNDPYTNFAILLSKDDVDIKTNLLTLLNLMLSKTPKQSSLRKKMVLYWQRASIVKMLSTMVDIQSDAFRSQLDLFQKLSNVTIPRSWLEVQQLKGDLQQLKKINVALKMVINEYDRQQPYFHLIKDELLRCYKEMGTMARTGSNPGVSFTTHPQSRSAGPVNHAETTQFQDPESFVRDVGIDISATKGTTPATTTTTSTSPQDKKLSVDLQPEYSDKDLKRSPRPRPGLPDAEAEIERLQQRITELESKLTSQDLEIDRFNRQHATASIAVQTVISGDIEKVTKNEKMSHLKNKLAGLLGGTTMEAKKEESFLSPSEFDEITENALFDAEIAKDPVWEWNEEEERLKAELERKRQLEQEVYAREEQKAQEQKPASATTKKKKKEEKSKIPPPSSTDDTASKTFSAPQTTNDAISLVPGAPAPPLPPPPPGAPPAPTAVKLSKPEEKPGQRLRQLHWQRILTTDENTVWGQLHERYDAFQFDKNRFEHLFSMKESASLTVSTQSNDDNDVPVRLLDDKRFNMLSILLHKLPDTKTIQRAVLTFDSSILTRDQLQMLQQAMPTEEEKQTFQQHLEVSSDDLKELPERFIAMVLETPVFEERVRSWLFIIDFKSTVRDEVMAPLECCSHCITEIMSSSSLRLFLGYVLRLGNYMNGSNAGRSRADGFDIGTLMKLSNTKDRFNKTSLMDHVCDLVRKNHPAAAEQLPKELQSVLLNFKKQYSANLEQSVQKLLASLRKFEHDTNNMMIRVPDHNNDQGIAALQRFLEGANKQVEHIDTSYTNFLEQFRNLMQYFGIPRSQQERTKPHDIFEPLGHFLDCYVTIMRQYERKRAQQRSAGLRINGNNSAEMSKQQDPMSSVVAELQMQLLRQRAASRASIIKK